MPELPEVETVKRGLTPFLSDQIITNVTLNRANLRTPFPDNMPQRLKGKKCTTIRRRGKYIWMDLNTAETLVIHLGMSGSFKINPATIEKHDHVIFETNTARIVYNDPRRFGMMFFVTTDKEHMHKAFAKMGPEPLGNDFNGDIFHTRLLSKKSPIKITLLDQNIVAGVGNIYACEALYIAGINPQKPSCDLTLDECDTLSIAIQNVLDKAIESGGSSLRDHKQVDGAMGYFQHHFSVYGREGEKCPETGDVIQKITQSGRSTFYCPLKQR